MAESLYIVMLEDAPEDAKLVERALRAAGLAFESSRVDTREAFVAALRERRPDVILADYNVPGFDCLAALKLAHELRPDAPVVVVTGTLNDEAAVELLHEGAQDYVLKDRLSRLGPAINRAIERARAREEKRRADQALLEQLDELRRFQRVTVDREARLQELEEEVARLQAKH